MLINQFELNKKSVNYSSLSQLADDQGFSLSDLPVSIKILLENLIVHADGGNPRRSTSIPAGW
jgi:aconitase A